jgi:hypothetical protein
MPDSSTQLRGLRTQWLLASGNMVLWDASSRSTTRKSLVCVELGVSGATATSFGSSNEGKATHHATSCRCGYGSPGAMKAGQRSLDIVARPDSHAVPLVGVARRTLLSHGYISRDRQRSWQSTPRLLWRFTRQWWSGSVALSRSMLLPHHVSYYVAVQRNSKARNAPTAVLNSWQSVDNRTAVVNLTHNQTKEPAGKLKGTIATTR